MNIPSRMKAAVLYGPGDLRVIEKAVPQVDYQEVLIRVRSCAICGTDPHIVSHGWLSSPPMGEFTPGHEYAGEIVKTGPSVHDFHVGDRVTTEPHKGCGHCINCIRGSYTACLNYGKSEQGHRHYGFTANGGYAEYAVAHVNCLHRLTDAISFDEATLATGAAVAMYGIQRSGWIGPGETVVIIGPGHIGLHAAQLASVCGAGQVIVTGTRDSRLELAAELGADVTINIQRENLKDRIEEITSGKLADFVIEASGSKSGAGQAMEVIQKEGRICFLGVYSEPVALDLTKIILYNLSVYGARGEGSHVIERIIPLMDSGKINVKKLITHQFPLDEINRAFETFIKRIDGALTVIIHP